MATTTIDHDEIRSWAEKKGGKPASVDRTHHDDDVGIIRLMFPKNTHSEHQHLVEISWEEFFEQFEESKLALIYEPDSLFSKLVSRDGAHTSDHEPTAGKTPPVSTKSEKPGEDADLKAREYRDEQGNIRHHTHAYMDKNPAKH